MGVDAVRESLASFGGPWWIAGGHAVDLFVGEQTRAHADVDVAVLRRDGETLVDIFGARRVGRHQLRADGFDLLLNDADGDTWIFRRDGRVTRPLGELGFTHADVPVLAPEIVLLFKAKDPRPKDEADRAILTPRLGPGARAWLDEALRTVYPGHRWLPESA